MQTLLAYRNSQNIQAYVQAIKKTVTRPWTIMEICGGQTHSIMKYGLDQILAGSIELVHGPGCPVCVTPQLRIDQAIDIAQLPQLILCTYGDMMRVPGSVLSLAQAKAKGADVRVVTTAMEVLQIAQNNPDREVVFLAIGFETTAPAHAMLVYAAAKKNLQRLSLLVSHVLVPPAVETIFADDSCIIDALLAAGHVCSIMGIAEYQKLVLKYAKPIVVTGFEPVDILEGILRCVTQLEAGRFQLENQYARAVRSEGNLSALSMLREVFEVTSMEWRGLGSIPESGLRLKEKYRSFDAELKFLSDRTAPVVDSGCQAGQVLRGLLKPDACPCFGKSCTPEHPLGAPMVSTEGACAAYSLYHQFP